VRDYYAENPDIQFVSRDQRGEYGLFVKVACRPAYEDACREAWEVQYKWAEPWKELIAVADRLSVQPGFSYAEFVMESGADQARVGQFLAFCTHTGLLGCGNSRERIDARVYVFPKLFRRIPGRS
jgi:hypothetical protein